MKVIFKLALAFAGTCALSACGTFPLSGTIYPPSGKSAEEQQTDVLVCKDQANLAVNSASNQAGDFLLGATIIGAPFAYQMDKSKERAVFARCMTARGYIVNDVNDSSTPTHAMQPAAATVNSAASKYSMTLYTGWEQKPIPPDSAQRGIFFFAFNQATNIAVSLNNTPRTGMTDLMALTEADLRNQASAVQNPRASNISALEVNGNKALRFTVTGVAPGTGSDWVFLHTLIEGKTDIVDVDVVASAANFQNQRQAMENLAKDVTGL